MNQYYHEEEKLDKAYDSRLMKRLLKYLKPYKKYVISAFLLLAIASLLKLAGPYLVKIAIDRYIMAKDYEGLVRISGIFFGLLLLQFVVRYAQTYMMQLTGQMVNYDLRMQIFSHLQRQNLSFFNKNPVGRLLTRVTSDVQVLNELFSSGVVAVFGDFVTLIGIVIVMFSVDWKLSLVTFISVPFLVLATILFRKRVRDSYRKIRLRIARVNAFLQEHISGMKIIQLFAQERKVFNKFDSINASLKDAHIKSVFYYAVFFPVVELIGAVSLALIIFYGGSQLLKGAVTFGVLVAFIQYAEMFYSPIRDLAEKYNILQSAMASSERIFKLLDREPEIVSPKDGVKPEKLKGEIEFKNVWFAYEDENYVLKNLNFKVNPGETIALVGATGAGKTSIINLLFRFYEFQKGNIYIDGIDIRNYDIQALRRQMGLVLQDVFIFSGDVTDNIGLGEEIDDDEVISVSRYVNAEKFIKKMENGYKSRLQESGSNLSEGQKQLLSFARALAFKPRILMLDEATSSVDTETEQLIQEAMHKMSEGRSCLIIAHRLSTIRNADRIIVMHHGEIREEGTHAQLLKKQGIYYRLYQLQYKDEETEVAGNQINK
ncbi:MAG: ATP-binding cassette domain-containing protein [candidate division Zixibacteria bacterium]|nr:ATP-binding cassette domain-containing protein [candidate division Zixibacteria bacterium]